MNAFMKMLVLGTICQHSQGAATTNLTEVDLHRRLFDGHNPDVIPNMNNTTPLVVDIEMFIVAIENIDEKRQTLTARAFLELTWTNDFLTWDSQLYGGVTKINVKNSALWLPDITLAGTLDKPLEIGQAGGRAIVASTGRVITWPYKTYTIACNISVARFPMDRQLCKFDFSFWTNPSSVLQLRNPTGNVRFGFFTESGEWSMVATDTELYRKPYGDDTYDHIVFRFHLERKWMFHAMNTMAPVICISVLNIFCFLLPSQSGERVTLCISIFLTLAVFLTVVNNSMPESSNEVAIFGVYIGLQLVGSAFNIIATVLAIHLYHRDTALFPVPGWLQLLTRRCKKQPRQPDPPSCAAEHNGSLPEEDCDCASKLVRDGSLRREKDGGTGLFDHARGEGIEPLTWSDVSVALDRIGVICAVSWHSILLCFLIIGVNVP